MEQSNLKRMVNYEPLEQRWADSIVRQCKSRDEIINFIIDLNYKEERLVGKNIDIDAEVEILWNRIQSKNKSLNIDIRLKGTIKSRQVWLNGVLLNFEKSMQAYKLTTSDCFYWGEPNSASSQLAFAILLELSSPDKALDCYQRLRVELIDKLAEEDFDIRYSIDY